MLHARAREQSACALKCSITDGSLSRAHRFRDDRITLTLFTTFARSSDGAVLLEHGEALSQSFGLGAWSALMGWVWERFVGAGLCRCNVGRGGEQASAASGK